ncbi:MULTISPECIES: flagellar biosynthesis protein FliQ [Idiomarina]|jgi:flagellar biosynthetic protein FliQ|uniref:Flagellar biosynthetic protein FliQ n=2 Tax=Idiomarina baltica TaxID=190892 RepID=A0A348WQ64_9GAMM|nr:MULTISPECIES: flagellar biosynthesis protein FliQ [Idiomarina]MEC8924781.1 flagellar biosynthesis protein FliQ [Pseudomonadota bacterium]EAQ32882.1 Flagellar biosynthesis protein FliQ [Idiomarina baltica OS145]KXS34138.1 MAG: flagellar biosynthesis protein FliQ [Idiomarina sp. T82-3]HAE90153.1 flagellar biosynthetic protein FliQ [Idiomarina sp.]HAR56676.1 flagellar biosynthetic protein FliQ [Idiomarina baltica]|tara:strand:+ start:6092 stop:6361 length:270 start_codon:yes stop_codon:yes gene_type:complete
MSPEVFLDVFQEALKVIVIIVAFIIVPSLLVGLMVAVFQAATSINEQTLSFLPRLLVTLAVIGLGGHFIVGLLMDFTIEMYNRIPQVVG